MLSHAHERANHVDKTLFSSGVGVGGRFTARTRRVRCKNAFDVVAVVAASNTADTESCVVVHWRIGLLLLVLRIPLPSYITSSPPTETLAEKY